MNLQVYYKYQKIPGPSLETSDGFFPMDSKVHVLKLNSSLSDNEPTVFFRVQRSGVGETDFKFVVRTRDAAHDSRIFVAKVVLLVGLCFMITVVILCAVLIGVAIGIYKFKRWLARRKRKEAQKVFLLSA